MSDLPALENYQLHYNGDLRGKIEGQIVGPNRMGELFTICQTEYDAERDKTVAFVRFTTQGDLDAKS